VAAKQTSASRDLQAAQYKTSFGRIAAIKGSEPQGKPLLVLLHSLGTSKRLYAEVIPELSDEFQCIAIDALGHGDSDRPPFEFTIPDHATAVIELIEQLRRSDQPVFVAGCSFGAILSMEIAARAPDIVSAILVNGSPGWHLESQRLARLHSVTSRMVGEDGLPYPDMEGGGTVVPASDEERAARRQDVQKSGRYLLSTMWAMAAHDLIPRLSRIRATTTILMGDKDWHCATSYTLSDGIEGAVLEFVEGAGHLTPYDAPAEVAAAIRRLHTRFRATERRADRNAAARIS